LEEARNRANRWTPQQKDSPVSLELASSAPSDH